MQQPSAREIRGPWRRRLIWLWVVALCALALYVGIAAPFASYFGEGMALVAVVVPPLMILLLGAGFAWLVALALSKPRA